jgi:hypothetical protein
MKVDIKVEGLREIEAALKELGVQAAGRVMRSALNRAATPIVQRARELAPQPGSSEDPFATGETKRAIAKRLRLLRLFDTSEQRPLRPMDLPEGGGFCFTPAPFPAMVETGRRMHLWGGKIMRFVGNTAAITGALAFALTLTAVGGPVAAGPVCNELNLGSRCATSSDIRSSIVLGGSGENGRLRVRNEDNDTAVELSGIDGNVTNLFSNLENESNGLVKAWAVINANGAVVACWRCNLSAAQTQRIATGIYEVDFTPLATDIRGRPRLTAPDGGDALGNFVVIRSEELSGDESSVRVITQRANTQALEDTAFTLAIY